MPQAPAQRDVGHSSDVATLVRLHHRRRGWALVATGSVIGLAVYAGFDADLFGHLAGTAETFTIIPIATLLALALAGLVVVIVDTWRVHRADVAARVSAKGDVSHYPLYAHAHRWPPRHPGSYVAGIFMLLAITAITAFFVPAQVNSWAYALGAEHQDTFTPVSYSQSCMIGTRNVHCISMTVGHLSRTGAQAYWGPQVPLGHPFGVRDPLWAWGTGRNLINGDGSAITTIVAGLFFDGVTLLLLYVLVIIVRETSPKRGLRRPVPAAADPGAARRTHQPEREHRSDGTRRRARRGRGKR